MWIHFKFIFLVNHSSNNVHLHDPLLILLLLETLLSVLGAKTRFATTCIKHQDWRQFTPLNGAAPQSKFGNVLLPLQTRMYMALASNIHRR